LSLDDEEPMKKWLKRARAALGIAAARRRFGELSMLPGESDATRSAR